MLIAHNYVGLHLGAEYNGDHGAAGPSMNELVARYLREGTPPDTNYFRLLVEQVRCFGDPRCFYYDDVSRVRAGGSHSSRAVYRENVRQSVSEIVSLVTTLAPRLIIVAGVHAYREFTEQILPGLPTWRGDLVSAEPFSSGPPWLPSTVGAVLPVLSGRPSFESGADLYAQVASPRDEC